MPDLAPLDLPKRYYTVGEVADLFDLSPSVVRAWEIEFNELKPHRTSHGERRFTPESIRTFQLIHHLLKERGFTTRGAKVELKRLRKQEQEKELVIERLQNLRTQLLTLREQL